MASKDDSKGGGVSKERYAEIIEMGRRGLFQEYTTATGEIVRTGRPRKIDTLETLDKAITDYMDYMDTMNSRRAEGEKPLIPTVSGFCVFCGTSRDRLGFYAIHVKDVEYGARLKAFQEYILSALQQMGLNGELATIPYMAELNNNHGYTNAPQVVRHEISADLPTVEDVRRRIPVSDKVPTGDKNPSQG